MKKETDDLGEKELIEGGKSLGSEKGQDGAMERSGLSWVVSPFLPWDTHMPPGHTWALTQHTLSSRGTWQK